MTQVFGNFVEMDEHKQEYLIIGFSPTSIPLQQRWRNNGLSADFLADYLSTFFPGEDAESQEQQTEVKDAVSYVANELLENAMKFNHLPSKYFGDWLFPPHRQEQYRANPLKHRPLLVFVLGL